MTQIIKILIISLLCISFCNLNALHNKKQEKKTKSAPKKNSMIVKITTKGNLLTQI